MDGGGPMGRIALLVSTAFFVGLGLGFLLAGRSHGPEDAGGPAGAAPPEAAERDAPPREPPPKPEEPRAPDSPALPAGRSIAELIAAVAEPPVERGKGTITGT